MKPMRVLMLSWEYPPRIVGGISPHVFDLSKELARLGVEVHVITKATPLAPDEEIEPSGVNVHRVHLAREPDNFIHEIQLLNVATDLRCRQLLEDWRPGGMPTIFHAHDWLSLDAARELKYEYQLPMVATVHATESGRNNGLHNDMQRTIHEQEYWLTYEAWRVIVCSEFMRGEVQRLFSCPPNKVDVIYNGVDTEKFQFDWSQEERRQTRLKYAAEDEKIVMYVGRFVREKGIQVLLNAVSVVLAREPKTKFLIVGGGARERFERFVRWAGLSDRVVFTGFMANRSLHQLYRIADVAVFPSLYEPFGIVALEGMAAGAAVVASDAGGLREVVRHDQTGTLSFAGDAESLGWAILEVIRNPERAEKLKTRAFARLGVEFAWPRIAEQTLEVYERVWKEFLGSFWADKTLWPVTPGHEERAVRRKVEQKAKVGGYVPRPIVAATPVAEPPTEVLSADEALAAGETESEEQP